CRGGRRRRGCGARGGLGAAAARGEEHEPDDSHDDEHCDAQDVPGPAVAGCGLRGHEAIAITAPTMTPRATRPPRATAERMICFFASATPCGFVSPLDPSLNKPMMRKTIAAMIASPQRPAN